MWRRRELSAIRDDRGVEVRAWRPFCGGFNGLLRPHPAVWAEEAGVLRELEEGPLKVAFLRRYNTVVLLTVFLVLPVCVKSWFAVACLLVLITLLVLQTRGGAWVKDVPGAERREALLGLGRCAGCAYRLDGRGREGDGCLVCSECGAAWRLG